MRWNEKREMTAHYWRQNENEEKTAHYWHSLHAYHFAYQQEAKAEQMKTKRRNEKREMTNHYWRQNEKEEMTAHCRPHAYHSEIVLVVLRLLRVRRELRQSK
jgi:hypothetical protein